MATVHAYYHEHVILDSFLMPFPITAPEMLVGISKRNHQVWSLNPSLAMMLEMLVGIS